MMVYLLGSLKYKHDTQNKVMNLKFHCQSHQSYTAEIIQNHKAGVVNQSYWLIKVTGRAHYKFVNACLKNASNKRM